MNYSEEEISLARKLRHSGLDWEPRAGHYVYDETGFCKKSSPFQEKVYFILNYDYFMQAVGGVDRFKEIMLWLPTWHDARQILASLAVPNDRVQEQIDSDNAIVTGTERLVLYQLIESALTTSTSPRQAGLRSS